MPKLHYTTFVQLLAPIFSLEILRIVFNADVQKVGKCSLKKNSNRVVYSSLLHTLHSKHTGLENIEIA